MTCCAPPRSGGSGGPNAEMKQIPARWGNAVLVCGKCSKRLDGGFGPKGDQRLAKALRRHLGLKKGRKAPLGIVEVKCMGVCPNGAVTVISAADPETWNLVAAGADLDEVARELGLTRAPGVMPGPASAPPPAGTPAPADRLPTAPPATPPIPAAEPPPPA